MIIQFWGICKMAVFGLTDFFDKLNILDYTMYLSDNGVTSQAESGLIQRALRGPRLWTGTITCQTHRSFASARELEALCQHVQSVGNHFLVRDKKAAYPASRVVGDGLTNAGLSIVSPIAAGHTVTLSGLPANYVLSGGDSFSYSLNGVYRLHKIALGATANASGVVTVTLVNPLTAGSLPSNGTAIQLINPRVTAQIVPGSLQLGTVGLPTTSGLSFSWIQSVKV